MTCSSAGSSRLSSSNRKVERTLSDSDFGNMMPSLKAPTVASRDKGKRKAIVVQEEDDDVIVEELGEARQTSSSERRLPRAASAAASPKLGSTSRPARPTQPAPSEASSNTFVAPKNTQRKRKAEPGDGFKMDFKHTQGDTRSTATSHTSSYSSRCPMRQVELKQTVLAPSSSWFASSSHSHRSSTNRSSSAFATISDARPTQCESSFTSILPSALAGSTQDKPKLKPLHTFRPPPASTIRSTSPLFSPPLVKAAVQPPPRPVPSSPSAIVVSHPGPLPPHPIPAPSPRRRKRIPPQPRSSTLDHILETTDWAELHSSLEISHLFRLEYALYGGLAYNQVRAAVKREQFGRVTRKSMPATVEQYHEPSWIGDETAVGMLKKTLGDKEHFVALVWARDVLGRNKMEEGSVGEEGELRKAVIGGVDMYLLGKEFPLKLVIVVGMIIGVSEKDTTVSYEVDDGTGVITCTCNLRQRDPVLFIPLREMEGGADGEPRTPSPRKRKVEELTGVGEDRLEVGTLVRVVGRVEEHLWAATADRIIVTEKMEALHDVNLEAEHHLQVARLHHEVYSKPLDLRIRLAQIKQAEAEQWSHLTSSQASSSTAGTPAKRIRLSRPIKLHDDDITSQNFVTYIRQHLRDHHVDRPSSFANQPSSTPSSDGAFWDLKFASQDRAEKPTPFTLGDIESDRQLVTFATRLAQKTEREKRAKKKVGALGREKGKLWVSKEANKEFTSVKGVGSHGGSTLMLRTVSSGLKASKRLEKVTKDEQPLDGAKLEKAISKCFREALIEMRQKGVIVLREPEMEEASWAADSKMLDNTYLPDTPSHALPATTSNYCPTNGRPWPVLFAKEEKEEKERRPSPRDRKRPKGPNGRFAMPWDYAQLWNINLEDPVEGQDTNAVCASSPPGNLRAKKRAQSQWDVILEGDSNVQQSKRLDMTSDDCHTPRSTHTRFYSDVPRSPSTVKASRTTDSAQPQSTSVRSHHQILRTTSSPPTFEIPSLFQSPRRDRTFATDSSWTTSIAAVGQETYELVTHTSLGPPILRVLRNVYSGQRNDMEHTGGVSERRIREALVRDARWAGVASYSDLVGKALKALEEQGDVQSVGLGQWKPMTGLGFTKGRW